MSFAELAAKSNFSFLEGASHPEELVAASVDLGLSAIGIADREGIYGLVRAYRAAKEHGAHLVAGAELTIEYESRALGRVGPGSAPPSVLLLVRDHDGYASLCDLVTAAHATHEKGTAGLSLDALAAGARGLELVIVTDRWSIEAERLSPGDWGSDWADVLDAFRGRTHVATYRRLDALDEERTLAAETLASGLGCEVFASGRPLFHHASRKPLADVVHCVRHGTTLDEAGRALASNAEARLRSEAQMRALFKDRPSWVDRAGVVAERMTFSFAELAYRFPSDELTRGEETPDAMLARLTADGLARRYADGVPAKVRGQCDKELALISKLGVAPYFLSVWDVVEMARRRRILCQGRGSAANSAVCFALGVTAVDPARTNLLFERFLSAERAEPPDIDVDFEHERLEEVIQEIYEKYGRDRAAMVCNVIAYRGKSAMREVGKVFGLATDQVDRLSSLVLRHDLGDLKADAVRELGLDPADPRLMKAVAIARQLEGTPRHLGIHVGGFVLSAEPLARVAPVEPARMENRTVIPWDKDDLDTLGFFKVDVLGLGMLTCVRKSLALLHEHGLAPGQRDLEEPFDPIEALARLPPEDSVTYDAICRADTVGVFQIESRAQMAMLPRLRPRTFYDLVIQVAIVRPGPIQGGMVHPFLRRRQGKERAVAPHPVLEPILDRTLGVPLFQEQVMQIAMTGAGYSAGEADQLRRDMAAWKKHGRLERHRERLLSGFARQGISKQFGEQLYLQIQGFGEYGFPESHAASFALIVYSSSWLKTHHPGVFACALLNAQPMGFYSPSSIVQDATRHGVKVRAPLVTVSGWDNALEPDDASTGGFALRLGLRQISGIGEATARAIEAARAEAPFEGVFDVARRANATRPEIEALAEAGAFEPLVPGRRNAVWRAHAPRLGGLFASQDLESEAAQPALPPVEKVEQLLLDYGRLGLSLDDHPMHHVRPHLAARDVATTKALADLRDRQLVRLAGLVIGRQRPMTASGVTFITLEDETGIANLVVTVPVFEKFRHVVLHAKLVLVMGRVEKEGEVIHVLVHELERLELPAGVALPAKSRDFH